MEALKREKNKILIIVIIVIAIIALFFSLKFFTREKKEEIVFPVENEIEDDFSEEENKIIEDENEKSRNNEEVEDEKEKTIDDFVQCLAQAGMVIYGSKTCPACISLVNSFGGYEIIKPIYVECSEEWNKCTEEMQTSFVPEIQIKGKVYNGPRDLQNLGIAAGCEI